VRWQSLSILTRLISIGPCSIFHCPASEKARLAPPSRPSQSSEIDSSGLGRNIYCNLKSSGYV
jgi:hypothetical protein